MSDKPHRKGPDASRQAALEQTASDAALEQTPAQFMQKTSTDATAGIDAVERTATVTSFEESSQVPAELRTGEEVAGARFLMQGELGSGATSRVYAVHDRTLERTVAVKFLRRKGDAKPAVRERFVHEARVTAKLEHPNILPVHDMGVTDRGELYFSMKSAAGCTLGDAIRAGTKGEAVPAEFTSVDGKVRILLKVCDALAFAHSKGYIHQDVKPDNIMLGEYGEVLLVDWGSALGQGESAGGKGLLGTPAYMSPEQARRERADARSDVYCLAATFFHALLLRHPAWSDDAETFWEKKRSGALDAPDEHERRRIPRQLLAIALKGLAPEPARRYQSVAEFADDLKHYQAGQAVKAYHESPLERFLRWYRRNQRLFWMAAAVSAVVLGAGGLLFREKIQELITWRRFFSDDFSSYTTSAELSRNWKARISYNWFVDTLEAFSEQGHWRVHDGALQTSFEMGFANICLNRGVPGDMRVEWSATALRTNANLNCFVAGETRNDGYTFHVGGMGRADTVFLTRQRNFTAVARAYLGAPLVLGRTYRLRMEKEGTHVRFFFEGRRLIDWNDMDDISGPGHQTFGFENCMMNDLRIDNVQVYYHPLPLKVSPLATANRFFGRGYLADALAHYREVAAFYPATAVGREARYREARCLAAMDSNAAAVAALAAYERDYPRDRLVPFALAERSRLLARSGDTAAGNEVLRRLAVRYPGHDVLRLALQDMSTRRIVIMRDMGTRFPIDSTYDTAITDYFIQNAQEIQDWGRRFHISIVDNDVVRIALIGLVSGGIMSLEEAVSRFPEQRPALAEVSWSSLQDYESVLARYADQRLQVCHSLFEMGCYRRVLAECPEQRDWCSRSLLKLGRAQEVVDGYREQAGARAPAFVALGRIDQALAEYPAELTFDTLYMRLGRSAQALAARRGAPRLLAGAYCLFGRPDSALAVLGRVEGMDPFTRNLGRFEALRTAGRLEEALGRYPHTQGLEASIAEALRRLGRPRDVLALMRLRPEQRSLAWSQMGVYDSARVLHNGIGRPQAIGAALESGDLDGVAAAYPQRRELGAYVLLSSGRFENVLKSYPELPAQCGRALFMLGRCDEVLKRCPQERVLCGRSLIALGRAAEVLLRYPECRPEYAEWLVSQGRSQLVADSFSDQPLQYGMAMVALGRSRDAVRQSGLLQPVPHDCTEFAGLMALHEWRLGNTRRADSILAAPRYYDYLWPDLRFVRFMLRPVLTGLSGNAGAMRAACRRVADSTNEVFGQRQAYEARLLSGDIDSTQFLRQPYGLFVHQRLTLYQAMLDDVSGRGEQALAGYRRASADPLCRWSSVLRLPLMGHDPAFEEVFTSRTLWQFVEWRMGELEKRSGNNGMME
jgi:serine/threonine protein kinase